MSTILFSPCFVDGKDPSGHERLPRNLRYLSYYRSIKSELGFDDVYFADNASTMGLLRQLGGTIVHEKIEEEEPNDPSSDLLVFRFDKRLRGGGWRNYPYCWRALHWVRELLENGVCEKVVFIDTDGFVLSHRMMDYIRELKSGWVSFLDRKYNFPESSIHVLCRDEFDLFMEFTSGSWLTHQGKLMETTLPFTHVETKFNCGRYGEDRVKNLTGIHYYGQCPGDVEPKVWEDA